MLWCCPCIHSTDIILRNQFGQIVFLQLHYRTHCWLFVRILPAATVKMVDKSWINETYSLMKISILRLSLTQLHDLKSTCIQMEETSKLLSMIVPDALGNIETRSESQKIVGIENLLVCTWGTGWDRFPPDLTSLILGLRAPNFAHR